MPDPHEIIDQLSPDQALAILKTLAANNERLARRIAKMGTAHPIEVCKHLHLDVSTLSRNVERMKARGWLEVVPDEDGRSQPFRLTPQGRKLLEKAVPAWSEAQQQVKKVLGDGFVEQLNQAMKRVSKGAVGS